MEQVEIQSAPELIARKFRSALSICLIILGKRGSGKTDLALLIAETLQELGIIEHFATNIKVLGAPFQIDQIDNLRFLEEWAKTGRGRKLFIFDEIGKSIRRRTPMSALNIQMIDNLQILRKYKLSLVIIAPAEKYVDNAVLGTDILDARIVKPNNKNPKVAVWEDLDEDEQVRLWDIPATKIIFDSYDTAEFTKEPKGLKTLFKEEDKNLLWKWSAEDQTIESLGMHRETFNQKVKKYVKQCLEIDRQSSK